VYSTFNDFQNAEEEEQTHVQAQHGEHDGKIADVQEGLRNSAASWIWAWAIDDDERPPPSSIVSRRDTEEARRLCKIADLPTAVDAHGMSGNNLWSVLVNTLSLEKSKAAGDTEPGSPTPDREKHPGTLTRLMSLRSSRRVASTSTAAAAEHVRSSEGANIERVKSH